jgi:hypothetical protein
VLGLRTSTTNKDDYEKQKSYRESSRHGGTPAVCISAAPGRVWRERGGLQRALCGYRCSTRFSHLPVGCVTKAEFEANLRNDGRTQTLSQDGKADIFTKDGARYAVRDESNAGKPTADFTPVGATRATLKIRLPKP